MVNKPFLWDAGGYDKVTKNLEEWGTTVIKSRKWSGNETVLDAGCGSGKVTKVISLFTRGKIYAVDNDSNMIQKAKENLQGIENITVMHFDLLTLDSNTIPVKFDVIFSNAVLHWIHDHYKVFQNFYYMLRNTSDERGQLLIQCGGYGNLENTISVFDKVKDLPTFKSYFSNWKSPWNFAKPDNTESLLRELGYRNVKAYLFNAPVSFNDRESYLTYLKSVVLGPYLKQLPSNELKEEFLREIGRQIEKTYSKMKWNLDYIRLNIMATI
jgi:trans-aconitate 2-methyltransferase